MRITPENILIKHNLENPRKGKAIAFPYHLILPLFFLLDVSGFLFYHLFYVSRNSFRQSIGLLVENSLSFLSSKNLLISASFLKAMLTGYKARPVIFPYCHFIVFIFL